MSATNAATPLTRSPWRHLPNIITTLRLAAMPFIAQILLAGRFRLAVFAYFFAGSSDFLDGYLARRFGWQSKFGAVADPIADKLLVIIPYICLAIQGAIPAWLTYLVIGRDVGILLFAGLVLLASSIRDFPPSQWGKWSTGFQMLAVGATCTHYSDLWRVPLMPFFAITAIFTIISGIHYLYIGVSRLRAA